MGEDDPGPWILPLTQEEYESIGEGEAVEFTVEGGLIEKDPRFVVELQESEAAEPPAGVS